MRRGELQRTHRPADIRQVGVDISECERVAEELDLLRDIRAAESQVAGGEGVSHEEARSKVLSAFRS